MSQAHLMPFNANHPDGILKARTLNKLDLILQLMVKTSGEALASISLNNSKSQEFSQWLAQPEDRVQSE